MWDKIKAFGAWLYNWMTVVGALIVGGASFVLEQMEALSMIDFASILPPTTALKVVAAIAAVKTVCTLLVVFRAWYNKGATA